MGIMKTNRVSIYFFLTIVISFVKPLHSMENATTMSVNERLAWQIVLMHGVALFNYEMIDSLVVSKNHDAILRSTAECRKQFFMQKHPHFKEVNDLEWNTYGTACAKVQWGKKLNRQQIPLMTFLEFPALLKAFLNSTVIVFDSYDKTYALEGVEIHKNYQKWKQYFSTPQYTSFNDLPKFIRKAIVGRYKAQYELRKKIIC